MKITLTYPAATRHDFNEILRVRDAIQLTDRYNVSAPAEWEQSDDVIVGRKIKTEDIIDKFPKGHPIKL